MDVRLEQNICREIAMALEDNISGVRDVQDNGSWVEFMTDDGTRYSIDIREA